MTSTQKENKVVYKKIKNQEILSSSKAIGVITENIMLLKCQKQAITVALNGKDALMLLSAALEKSWIYQLLPFIVSRNTLPIRNKFPDREFYLSVDHEFYSRLGIWSCVHQSGLQTNSSENWCYCAKMTAL